MAKELKKRQKATMDGNQAAAYVAYAFTDVATIYPITPSSTMAEYVDEWQAAGRKNIFGQTVRITEMQSEGGAAGAFHGVLATGALASTFTASQGLLLMIPNMYRIAAEQLPGVMHVSARTLAGHALSIFGDHSDVMACAQTGFAMLCSANVQEAMDLAAVAHLSAIRGSLPFMHFFDGFRTSHEQQKIELWDYDELAAMVDRDALAAFRGRALNPEHPTIKGTAQNPDIFFQAREAGSGRYLALPAIVAEYMDKVSAATGRTYHPFDYYGDPEATDVVVAMGSISEVAFQAVDYLRAQGKKVGFLQVRLYRPFVPEYLLAALPKTAERLAVLDRTKVAGAVGNPLYQDVLAALSALGLSGKLSVIGGRYGLSSKDTAPADIVGVYNNLAAAEPKQNFTVAINDDIYHTSTEPEPNMPDMLPRGTVQCKFWGLGSDGTVGANKQAVAIINDKTELNAQAYFAYDSKKSGGITISHLRFGKEQIKAPYLIRQADFVSCSNAAYVHTYDLLEGLKPGGVFLLNCKWTDPELDEHLPGKMKRYLAENDIQFYTIDALTLAQEIGLGKRTNMIMQSAFFKLADIIPLTDAVEALNDSIEHAYGRKGQDVVEKNMRAVKAGLDGLHKVEIPAAWKTAADEPAAEQQERPDFAKKILDPINAQQGDKLPVSAFLDTADGVYPPGTAKYEKRGVAPFVPEWLPENCIQCNRCAMVCPHASIRPILLDEQEKAAAPEAFVTKKAIGKGLDGMEVRLQVSPLDCQGCASCVEVCPAKEKALKMVELDPESADVANWEYAMSVADKDERIPADNVKNAQYRRPYLEFSGACAGCGETPYAKLVTQLFGERMIIANATGCSSIWGASAPSMPYATNQKGQGPAWGNSLFEDNAEYGLGITLAVKQQREHLIKAMEEVIAKGQNSDLTAAMQEWLDNREDAAACRAAADKLLPLLAQSDDPQIQAIYCQRDQLSKKSIWIFGGDGWAYDIGYGGLDHVLASGENVNVLVFDTEVYSNTGGQSSKSTPAAAIAKFSVSGKKTKKKDLGMMAMSYGYVYVAQIAMGADMNQTLKAIREAEAYDGPSLIIAYSPCINHGIKAGMNDAMGEMARAVQAGYWHLYRYNPQLLGTGQNPFALDSKEPTADLREFLLGEVRYNSLLKIAPDKAEELFAKTERDARQRFEGYKRLAEGK